MNAPKIVHFLLGKANPNTMNGVNKVVHHLATEQLRLGLDVEVWGITDTPQAVRHDHEYPLLLFKSSKLRFSLVKALKVAINDLPMATIAHMHSVFIPEYFLIAKKLKSKNIPWVLSPHSGYTAAKMKKNTLIKHVYMALIEKCLVENAKKVHTLGPTEEEALRNIYSSVRLITVPNGQDAIQTPQNASLVREFNSLIFGYCGRLAKEHKGLDLLIKGFSLYRELGGVGELWFIGDGGDRYELEELAKSLNVYENITFFGPLFGEEKITKMQQFDVFLHPSRWDGMPMAALEAAALHKPLIISKETNLGDWVAKYSAGVVLRNNSEREISHSLFYLENKYKCRTLSELGDNAYWMIKESFSWTKIAKRIVKDVYCKS